MDRSRTDRNRNQRCSSHSGVVEPEYEVVEGDVPTVDILPAKPIFHEREYADRDLPRSPSAQSLSSLPAGNSSIISRKTPLTAGPAINRDLKPSRRKAIIDNNRSTPLQPEEQHSCRRSPSPPLTLELENHLAGLTLREPCSTEQGATKQAGFSPHTKGRPSPESCSAPLHKQRHSLHFETHDREKRSQQSLDCVPSNPYHERPQSADECDQQYCDQMEEPQRTLCEEEWYVGACNRAEAEHALHLVNKDGAFLVRDCSTGTSGEPFVLAVYHDKKVYNVKIRLAECTNKFTLGTRQRSHDTFDSVADIIKFHSIFPLILISGRYMPGSRFPENCVLTCPVTRRDVDQLLQ